MFGQRQRYTVRGAELAVWQSGSGGRDLVFVHGFQNDHTAWRPLIERLDEKRYRYTCFDLLGCGASAGADTWARCTISEYSADLIALCEMLSIDRPVVLGHSLGAAISLSAALANPGRFAGLVLIAPASTTGLDFVPDEASFTALAHPTREQQRALARAAFRWAPPEDRFQELMGVIELASPEHIEGAARSMRTFTCQPDLAALLVPSILICGVYFDIGHVPFVETPESCAADVEQFLSTIR